MRDATLADDRAYALRALAPPPRLQSSRWLEDHLVLPEGTAAHIAKFRAWPWQVGIADAISDSLIERVTLVKGVRLGFTTLLTGTIFAHVANDPASIRKRRLSRVACYRATLMSAGEIL